LDTDRRILIEALADCINIPCDVKILLRHDTRTLVSEFLAISFEDLNIALSINEFGDINASVINVTFYSIVGDTRHMIMKNKFNIMDIDIGESLGEYALYAYHQMIFNEKYDTASGRMRSFAKEYLSKNDVPAYYIEFLIRLIAGKTIFSKIDISKLVAVLCKVYPKYSKIFELPIAKSKRYWNSFFQELKIPYNHDIIKILLDEKLYKQACRYAITYRKKVEEIEQYLELYPDLLINYCNTHKIFVIDPDKFNPQTIDAKNRDDVIKNYQNLKVKGFKK